MKRSQLDGPAGQPGSPSGVRAGEHRLGGLQSLADEDAAQLRALTPQGGIRIFEELLDAGFELIETQIEDAKREGRDAGRLARFLLRDEAM